MPLEVTFEQDLETQQKKLQIRKGLTQKQYEVTFMFILLYFFNGCIMDM